MTPQIRSVLFALFVLGVLCLALVSACASTAAHGPSNPVEKQAAEVKLCAGIATARKLEHDFDALPTPGSARDLLEAEEDAICSSLGAPDAGK